MSTWERFLWIGCIEGSVTQLEDNQHPSSPVTIIEFLAAVLGLVGLGGGRNGFLLRAMHYTSPGVPTAL